MMTQMPKFNNQADAMKNTRVKYTLNENKISLKLKF